MANQGSNSAAGCMGCLLFLIALPIAGLWGCYETLEFTVERLDQQDKQRRAERQKLDAEKPIGSKDRLHHEINAVLPGGVSRIDATGGKVSATVRFNENITPGLTRVGIKFSICDILRACQSSGYDFSEIHIHGSSPLVNEFGETNQQTVVEASYSRSTVDRIHWTNFDKENIYGVADEVWLHPAVTGD